MTLAADLADALEAATLRPEDGATQALAVRYATLIDEAAPAAKYASALAWLAGEHEADDAARARYVDTIRAALSEHSVMSDLGPKLLAALDALGMSPRARAALQKGAKTGDRSAPSRLDELRAARARKNAAPTGDATAP